MESPYLVAIQHVLGDTPGEKYKTLNLLARKLVDAEKSQGLTVPVFVKPSEEIPEVLVPFVSLEVSKILRQPEGIVAALKSDDAFVFDRALKVKWFFDGTNRDISNVNYFEREIFPYTSLNNRIKIVKALSKFLAQEQHAIAEEFYERLTEKYGKKLAEPLLQACKEVFIKKTVWENKITLNVRSIQKMFLKFPNFVIEYLKLSNPEKSDDPVVQLTSHKINIHHYVDFLPFLLKNHVDAFVEIIEMHNQSLNVKLRRQRTDYFLKNAIDALLRRPGLFLPMMPLKFVTAKLTKSQFNQVFKQLFPEKVQRFNFKTMYNYLKFYPEEERMVLVLSTFEDLYGKSLLDFEDQVTPEVLRLLSPEQRVEQARKKLEKDPDWHLLGWDVERSWNSYLPIEESIPAIKQKISKCSDPNERCELMIQLVYTCHVNQDNDALLEVLNYIIKRHKNEQTLHLLKVFDRILDDFEAVTLPKEHWEVLEKCILFLYGKRTAKTRDESLCRLIVAIIHYKLIHHEEIVDFIDMYIHLKISSWYRNWNILQDHPEFERKCLDSFVRRANEIDFDRSNLSIIISLMTAIYDFNTRKSKAKCKLKNFSLRNFDWLSKIVRDLIVEEHSTDTRIRNIKSLLIKNEIDLYEEWAPAEKKLIELIEFDDTADHIQLKRDPKRILDNWEKYFGKCIDDIYSKPSQRFFLSCRWHQKLPIVFAEKCLKELEKKNDRSLMVLALLYEGLAFEKLLTPFIPATSTLDPSQTDNKNNYNIYCSMPSSMNIVNPPVSLDLILHFCQGDYIHLFVNCLVNVGRRVMASKVMEFSKELMTRGVSIKKHGIRLFCMVGDFNEVREMLVNLCKTENHRSSRDVVFRKIFELFIDTPSPQTWTIMKDSMNEVQKDDDALKNLFEINRIPTEFVVDYFGEVLAILTKLMDNGLERRTALPLVEELLKQSVALSVLFPEELHQHILRTFFSDLSRPEYALSYNIRNFVVDAYVCYARDKLEPRLVFLSELFIEIVKKYWDVPQTPDSTFLPGNYMIHMLIYKVTTMSCDQVKLRTVQVLQNAFLKVLRPRQAMNSYLSLVYCHLIDKRYSSKEISRKVAQILPSLIEEFSVGSITMMAKAFIEHLNNMFPEVDETTKVFLDVIEHLVNGGDEHSVVFAAMLLHSSKEEYSSQQYRKIVDELKKSEYPTAVSAIYNRINAYSPQNNSDDFWLKVQEMKLSV